MKGKERSKPQKKNRRSQTKYPALKPALNLRIRQELIDYDYLHKLNPKELEWLNQFSEEYYNATLDKKHPRKNLHNTKVLIKDCRDRNNKRNHDIMARAKASGQLTGLEEVHEIEKRFLKKD